MSADQVVTQRVPSRGIFRRFGRPRSWQLFALPNLVVVYVFTIIAADLSLTGWSIAVTPVRGGDLALFAALLACGAVCIEGTRRLGQPTGVSRDLLSAWWLPIALLLPPVSARLAPIILGALLYLRVRRTPAYRRLFSSSALGLAGASASCTFRHLGPTAAAGQSVARLAPPGGRPSGCPGSPTRRRTPGSCGPPRCWPRWAARPCSTCSTPPSSRSRRTPPSRRPAGPRCSGTVRACCWT